MSRKYNYIYSKLVESETDLKGIIAYSLYKQAKIKFIQQHKTKNSREPSEKDLDGFHRTSESHIQTYLNNSESILKKFEQEIIKRQKIKTFWSGVLQSMLGTFFIGLITAIVLFMIGIDLRTIF